MQLAFVIPAYNEENLIGSCLESVIREKERSGIDAEIIVVDNASTDRTRKIASSFPGVRVLSEKKKGPTYARRTGFEATRAEFVAVIDADTILPRGWIDKVRSIFEKKPELVAVSGPYIYYDLSFWNRFLVRCFYFLSFLVYLLVRFVFRAGSMVQGGNLVMRRTAWIKAGGYDTSIAFYGDDTDIAVRLSKVGPVKWTFKLHMLTSGRRLGGEGVFKTAGTYTLNYFWVLFWGRPATKNYNDIRPE